MAKIPFNIKYRPQIESGEYKVIDQFGYVLTLRDIINDVWYFSFRYPNTDYETERIYDHPENHLFLVTPDEEMTEFEKACMKLYNEGRDDGLSGDKLSNESLKESASELLALAKKEIGTTFDKAGEYLRGRNDGIEYGKAKVLNDLPRWEPNQVSYSEEPVLCNGNTILNLGLVHIHIDQLKKLPGFKEDEK